MTKTDRLIQMFGRQIVQGVFAPGSAMPSEAELCQRFDTSRNVMREVIKVLSTKRLIDAQRHRGLFVMPSDQWNYLDVDVLEWALENGTNQELISSLLEVRSLIEPTISGWAAQRATAIDLVAIESSCNEMAASRNDPPAFHEADIRFHNAILVATHNVVIQQLSGAISALHRAIFDYTFRTEDEHMNRTVRLHHELLDAIRCKNPKAAETVSRSMVEDTSRRAVVELSKEAAA